MRIDAMHKARRAYQKALHLAPQQGSLWGDLAATFYHEAQLRCVTGIPFVTGRSVFAMQSVAWLESDLYRLQASLTQMHCAAI